VRMASDCWRVAHHSHSREQSSSSNTAVSLMPTNYHTKRFIREVSSVTYIKLPYT